jgi:serine/threonine-protein kinase
MPASGDRLADRYQILAPLGAGGMATVYRARDERLEREVAIKVLLPNLAGDPATAERFEREARAMAAVAHPGLVAVFDVDAGDPATGREPFVVMELCPGGSLAERMGPGRPLPADELVPILVAVADALAALHHAGLVHRDVKPSNILFATDRVKLADFGLVRSETGSGAAELTDPGTAIGTLAYLAPERLRGDPGGPAADVHALATIAHLGLTGSLPRPTESVRDLVAAAPFRAPAVSTVAPGLGTAFDAAILDGLAVDPGRRPDAVTFGSRLASALGVWTRAGRPGAAPAPPSPGAGTAWTGTAAVGPALADDEVTTALAIPIDPTDRYEVTPAERALETLQGTLASEARRPEAPAPADEPRRERGSPVAPIAIAALLVFAAVVAAVAALGGGLHGPGTSSPIGPSGPAAASSASPTPSGSAGPSVSPKGTADPAVAALDAVDAAIAAARGGHDGLKGKEANDLESLAGRVRTAIAGGDRTRALAAARDLDRRVRDLADHLGREAADRLRNASAALVAALGG